MCHFKRIAALITFAAAALTVIAPMSGTSVTTNNGPRVHCC
jgi:hypothetical protein